MADKDAHQRDLNKSMIRLSKVLSLAIFCQMHLSSLRMLRMAFTARLFVLFNNYANKLQIYWLWSVMV